MLLVFTCLPTQSNQSRLLDAFNWDMRSNILLSDPSVRRQCARVYIVHCGYTQALLGTTSQSAKNKPRRTKNTPYVFMQEIDIIEKLTITIDKSSLMSDIIQTFPGQRLNGLGLSSCIFQKRKPIAHLNESKACITCQPHFILLKVYRVQSTLTMVSTCTKRISCIKRKSTMTLVNCTRS